MWVVYCNQTGVEYRERFEFRSEAEEKQAELEADDWQMFDYSIRLEAD